MYRFLARLTPEDVEAITAQAFAEMLQSGFTRVGEFHYLHNDIDGRAYANPGEMAVSIAAAAAQTGIGLTLLPVFYAHGGFGGAPPADGQQRFVTDLGGFEKVVEASGAAIASLPGANLGIAPHSLRAVSADELSRLVALRPEGPIHIHAGGKRLPGLERQAARRVAAGQHRRRCPLVPRSRHPSRCRRDRAPGGERRGRRPVPDHRGQPRRRRLPGAGLPGARGPVWRRHRLQHPHRRRPGAAQPRIRPAAHPPAAQCPHLQGAPLDRRNPLRRSARRRRPGAGSADPGLAVGARADLLCLNSHHPALVGRSGDALLDGWIFAGAPGIVAAVWRDGVKVVRQGRHKDGEAIGDRYRQTLEKLLA